jgi:hypothetical protein
MLIYRFHNSSLSFFSLYSVSGMFGAICSELSDVFNVGGSSFSVGKYLNNLILDPLGSFLLFLVNSVLFCPCTLHLASVRSNERNWFFLSHLFLKINTTVKP